MSSAKQTIKEGEILFKEGSFSDCAYIIESGVLEVLKKDDTNEEIYTIKIIESYKMSNF